MHPDGARGSAQQKTGPGNQGGRPGEAAARAHGHVQGAARVVHPPGCLHDKRCIVGKASGCRRSSSSTGSRKHATHRAAAAAAAAAALAATEAQHTGLLQHGQAGSHWFAAAHVVKALNCLGGACGPGVGFCGARYHRVGCQSPAEARRQPSFKRVWPAQPGCAACQNVDSAGQSQQRTGTDHLGSHFFAVLAPHQSQQDTSKSKLPGAVLKPR